MSPISVIGLLTGFAVTWLLMLLREGGTADRTIFAQLYVAGHPWLIAAAKASSELGIPPVYYSAAVVAAAVLAWRRRFVAAVLLLVLVVFGRSVEQFQKAYFDLARPDAHFHLAETSTSAFPSGHAANATITYVGAALLLAGSSRSWRWMVASALILVILIGLSRVMLGVHWPADVVGGWAFGGFWTVAWLRFADWLRTRELRSAAQF